MGPQRRIGIYVGFVSPSIIKFIELASGGLFNARFADCVFDEAVFPALEGEVQGMPEKQLYFSPEWPASKPMHLDPPSQQRHDEVYRILNLHRLIMVKPDAVLHLPKSILVPTTSTPVEIPTDWKPANQSEARKRRGRPPGSKNKKVKAPTLPTNPSLETNLPAVLHPIAQVETSCNVEPSKEVLVFHTAVGVQVLTWERQTTHVDDVFCFNVAAILEDEDDEVPKSYEDAKRSKNWKKWQEAVTSELHSLTKRKVFGAPQEAVQNKTIVGNLQHHLHMHLMDVVTAYLYDNIAEDIYMRTPEGLPVPKHLKNPVVKILKSIYGLKQSGRNWVSALSSGMVIAHDSSGMVKPSSVATSSGIVTTVSRMGSLAKASLLGMMTPISSMGVLVGYADAGFMSDSSLPFDESPMVIFEDNSAIYYQVKSGYIKGERTKHIAPKFFFTSELDGSKIRVERVASSDNVVDIFTKILPPTSHWKFVEKLGLRRFSDFHQGELKDVPYR
ncbi:hypothetical protein R1sor_007172 [Riccia sorocarpa]|uniref:Reverse transcriptase Ty1/copia-type domain-containing protein n=1 Tax=Riccia sorocarpa TaxID=122646 RepID=A0ABD3HTV1_9MARC